MALTALEAFRQAVVESAPDGGSLMAAETRQLQREWEAGQAGAAERAAWDKEFEAEGRRVERQTAMDAVYLAVVEQEPPSADELGLDVIGLQPARATLATLARHAAWLDKLQGELADLEGQRISYLKAQGVPAQTEAEIKALEEADRTGFLKWRRRGSPAMDRPELHSFQREQLLAKLPADRWAAELAIGELDRCDQELATKAKEIETVSGRRDSFVRDAVIEAAAPVAARVDELCRQLEAEYRKLLGLAQMVGEGVYRGYREDIDAQLPRFAVPAKPGEVVPCSHQPSVHVSAGQAKEAAQHWRKCMVMLADDPRVELPAMNGGE